MMSTAPSVSPTAKITWAISAVIIRCCYLVALSAAVGLPRTHPVRTYMDGIGRENAIYQGVYTELPSWAIQAGRAALLFIAAALLYSLLFDVIDLPSLLGIDHDPILHRPIPPPYHAR